MVRGINSPAFLCLSPDGRCLYAASEVPERPEGVLGAYSISASDGTLTELGIQGMGGAWASYLTMDPAGRTLLVSDYGRGLVALLPVAGDGTLGEVASLHHHHGSGPNAERQDGPHTHCIVIAPDGRYAFAADLGTDGLVGYQLNAADRVLTPLTELALPPGSGPRHLTFAPDGRHAYLIGELDSTVSVLAYQADHGRFRIIETCHLLPDDFEGFNLAADVHTHHSGRFVYCSNRGHDSIAMFEVGTDGRLQHLGHRSTEGLTPRSFAISPDGRFLLVGNQDSDTIVTMPIDPHTGLLGPTASTVETPTPVCLVFGPS